MSHSTTSRAANALLTAGMLAGPMYIGLAVLQMLIRPGFDPTRHDWSLLSNGDLGWIHILNFLLTGSLVIATAIGIRRRLLGQLGSSWGPLLLGPYGLGLIGAGLFVADPMNGFPLGTPDGPPVRPTVSGVLHIVTGAVGFVGLIAACFVFARRFRKLNQPNWALFSVVTGIVFLVAFVGIAGGSQQRGIAQQIITLSFTAAVLMAWSWLSLVAWHLKRGSLTSRLTQ